VARTIGSMNKIKQLVADRCAEMGADPLAVLCEALKDKNYRFEAAKELMSYIYPKRKSMEFDITEIPDDTFAREAERRTHMRILKGEKVG